MVSVPSVHALCGGGNREIEPHPDMSEWRVAWKSQSPSERELPSMIDSERALHACM
jgi:hypothetical protein